MNVKNDFFISSDIIWFTIRREQTKLNRGFKRLVLEINFCLRVGEYYDHGHMTGHCIIFFVTSFQSQKDVESAVNSRIADYQAYIEEIAEYYEESGQHINADQDIHTVFECIESIIVNPIPRKN